MLRALFALFLVSATPAAYAVMQCPTALVVVSCKAQPSGPADLNGFVPYDWVTKDAMLICKREEVPLLDAAEMQGAPPINPNFSDKSQCARAAMMIAPEWNGKHGNYFFLTAGCPTAIVNIRPDGSEEVIGYMMPPCPSWVKCENDSVI